jgi:UDPglucose 6-dehydrogenase
MRTQIAVIGSGYVGMSLSVLLAQHHDVSVYDIDPNKVRSIKEKKSTVIDEDIQDFLNNTHLNLSSTENIIEAVSQKEFVIIATPTDYDDKTDKFDTSSVDHVIKQVLNINSAATIIIKSTVPVGYTNEKCIEHDFKNIIFSPEFLREGKALHDNLFPSRIIVGQKSKAAVKFANILKDCSKDKSVQLQFTDSSEAEAIKLFANTYLAMRVAFFNELDSYSLSNNLNSKDIIEGISLDPRIQKGYNNPSFGYGGYCLPKDTKQLLANFSDVPQDLIKAVVNSNETRKSFIASEILKLKPETVGVHRLVMKHGSDNFRFSAVKDIINILARNKVKIIIYEPLLTKDEDLDFELKNDLNLFKTTADIIITNRISDDLIDVAHKLFTRDVFREN